jgi:hypothetical protein
MLTVGGFFERGAPGVGELIRPLSINLLVGLGDSRENAERSFAAAVLAAGGVDAQ